MLKGTGKDPDGDALTFSWEQISGPNVQLKQADAPSTSFNASSLGEDKILRFVPYCKGRQRWGGY